MSNNIDFRGFNTGTLFLVRTPEVFPVGYAEESFEDMKHNLHFDFAALLETWNCIDGVLWKSDKYPRSGFWKGEERDPIEECFLAADKYGMAFLPEAGMMHQAYMEQCPEGMCTSRDGKTSRFGRIGLSPSCPLTLEYFIEKYDAMLAKFGHHPSCKGICMPCENGARLTYDKYTRLAWRENFGCEMPAESEIRTDKALAYRQGDSAINAGFRRDMDGYKWYYSNDAECPSAPWMIKAIGLNPCELCTYCWCGKE